MRNPISVNEIRARRQCSSRSPSNAARPGIAGSRKRGPQDQPPLQKLHSECTDRNPANTLTISSPAEKFTRRAFRKATTLKRIGGQYHSSPRPGLSNRPTSPSGTAAIANDHGWPNVSGWPNLLRSEEHTSELQS